MPIDPCPPNNPDFIFPDGSHGGMEIQETRATREMKDTPFRTKLLAQWIANFLETHAVPDESAGFVAREIERLIQEKRDFERVDPLLEPDAPACPGEGDDPTTCREEMEQAAAGIYAGLLALLKRGHSQAFAEAAARSEWLGERPDHVSAEGYAAIRRGYEYTAEDPAALDAERAALTQGASPAVAHWCSRFLFDWDFHFNRALDAATRYVHAEAKARTLGYAAAGAHAYAMQTTIGECVPQAIKRFAREVDRLVEVEGMEQDAAYLEAFGVLDEDDG